MILYVCKEHGPLAEMNVKGQFDLRITCRICGGFGCPVHSKTEPQKMNKQYSEQPINSCQLKGG